MTAGSSPVGPPSGVVRSVLWSWLGLAASVLSALLLTPFIIKRVGVEAFGVWAIVFALTEGAWFLDLGIRSATGHFVARASAARDDVGVNQILNTSVAFFGLVSAVVVGIAVLTSGTSVVFFGIPAALESTFRSLLALAVAGWTVSALFGAFDAYLEGTGRFDILARLGIAATFVRTVGALGVLLAGGTLVMVGAVTTLVQILAAVAAFVVVRQQLPGFRLSLDAVRLDRFRQLLGYGGPALAVSIANRVIASGGPLTIAHFGTPEQVAHYAVPWRLVQLMLEPCYRVGAVVRARVAGLGARGPVNFTEIADLVRMANRYTTIFIAAGAIVLIPFAYDLLALWATPELALTATPLLRVLVIAAALGIGSQFSSGAALFGLGTHRTYSLVVVSEAVGGLLLSILLVPRIGAVGAALAYGGAMVLARGLITPWLFCRQMNKNWLAFCGSVLAPLVLAVPIGLAGWVAAASIGPESPLLALLAAAGLSAAYVLLALRFCVRVDHRVAVLARLSALPSSRIFSRGTHRGEP